MTSGEGAKQPSLRGQVADQIRKGGRFLLLTHRGPDGDGLGSMVGLAEVLRGLGKQVMMLLPDGAPEGLRWLAGVREAVRKLPAEAMFDVSIVFDCGDPRLLEGALPSKPRSGTVIVLDHHPVSVDFGDLCWRDGSAAAVGVMVYELAQELGVALSAPAAEAIYLSIVSDTGGFRYANTNAKVLRMAAALAEAGADPWKVTQRTMEAQPAARLVLLRRVLETLSLSLGDRFATLTVTDEMLKECGANAEMVEGFVNYARSIRGVEVGALLSKKGSSIRASLRGRGGVNLGEVAGTFGGGGHHDAAGCEISAADIPAARALLEKALAKALERKAS